MNIRTQRRLARAPGLEFFRPLQFRDVRRDAANRIRFRCAVAQQKLIYDEVTLSLRRRNGYLKLYARVRVDYLQIVRL